MYGHQNIWWLKNLKDRCHALPVEKAQKLIFDLHSFKVQKKTSIFTAWPATTTYESFQGLETLSSVTSTDWALYFKKIIFASATAFIVCVNNQSNNFVIRLQARLQRERAIWRALHNSSRPCTWHVSNPWLVTITVLQRQIWRSFSGDRSTRTQHFPELTPFETTENAISATHTNRHSAVPKANDVTTFSIHELLTGGVGYVKVSLVQTAYSSGSPASVFSGGNVNFLAKFLLVVWQNTDCGKIVSIFTLLMRVLHYDQKSHCEIYKCAATIDTSAKFLELCTYLCKFKICKIQLSCKHKWIFPIIQKTLSKHDVRTKCFSTNSFFSS